MLRTNLTCRIVYAWSLAAIVYKKTVNGQHRKRKATKDRERNLFVHASKSIAVHNNRTMKMSSNASAGDT